MTLGRCGNKEGGNTGVVNPNEPLPKAVSVNMVDPIVDKAIRHSLKKSTGELTEASLEKVRELHFWGNQLTDVKGQEKLTK